MLPRVIMTDFRDNFGNFSSCFAVESQTQFDKQQNESQWDGSIMVSEQP